jgi:hypothetical protein
MTINEYVFILLLIHFLMLYLLLLNLLYFGRLMLSPVGCSSGFSLQHLMVTDLHARSSRGNIPRFPQTLRQHPSLSLRGGGCHSCACSSRSTAEAAPEPDKAPAVPEWSRDKTLVLFDIDGTLTEPRRAIQPSTRAFLERLRMHVAIGVVGEFLMPPPPSPLPPVPPLAALL